LPQNLKFIYNLNYLITMSRFKQLQDLVNSLEGDFEKFYDKSNNAAGTRVRKGMQEMKNLAQEIRLEVQNKKNG
jgi:hypothetical protein